LCACVGAVYKFLFAMCVGMFSSLFTSGRKSATRLVDALQRTETRPYEDWRREYDRVNEELARAEERMQDFGTLTMELSARGLHELASQTSVDYGLQRERREELLVMLAMLKEERDRRAWYHRMRRWLVP